MYESPINLIEKQMAFDIDKAIEGEVWKVTKEIGIDVNKEELIKALQYDRDQYEKGYKDAIPKWIPVSERLPKEREWYLAVFKEKDTDYQLIPRVADYIGNGENKWQIIDEKGLCQEYKDILECIAWMPLPYPYKAESER